VNPQQIATVALVTLLAVTTGATVALYADGRLDTLEAGVATGSAILGLVILGLGLWPRGRP
jgi:hypothetical protein